MFALGCVPVPSVPAHWPPPDAHKAPHTSMPLRLLVSRIMTYSKNEIRYLVANKRYKMGKPVLTDEE